MFPDMMVVKTLCTVDARLMVAPDSSEGPSTVFLSGDDAEAKRTVGGLLNELGWPAESLLDLGGITTARGQEHYSLLFLGSPTPSARTVSGYGWFLRPGARWRSSTLRVSSLWESDPNQPERGDTHDSIRAQGRPRRPHDHRRDQGAAAFELLRRRCLRERQDPLP